MQYETSTHKPPRYACDASSVRRFDDQVRELFLVSVRTMHTLVL
jgi:hypothetical protein